MKAIWVLLALALGVVSAEVNLGYQYTVPPTSFTSAPSYNLGGSSNDYSSAFASSGSGSYYKEYPSFSSTYGNGNLQSGFGSSDLNSGIDSSFGSGLSSGYGSTLGSGLDNSYYLNSGFNREISSIGNIAQPIYQYTGLGGIDQGNYQSKYQSNEYKASALNKYKNYYQVQQQPAQVFKHFYVHAAPEEPEPVQPRTPLVLPPAQKHYKIIFIKTPSQSRTPQVVPVPQVQNEEKTIVYVLVKKPEEAQDVIVPKVEQKPPTKPEVFFIKYKNKEDSQTVIDNIVKDYNQGQSVSLVNTGAGESSSFGSSGLSTVAPLIVNSGLSINSGLSDTFGNSATSGTFDSSSFSSTYDNSGLSNNFDNSGLSGSFGTSGLSGSFGTSGLSGSFGTSGLSTNFENAALSGSYGSSGLGSNYESSGFTSQNDASATSFGNSFGVTPSPATQTLSVSSIAPDTSVSPVTVSSTASSITYDEANAISTSQGIPHETYGPPKFRVD